MKKRPKYPDTHFKGREIHWTKIKDNDYIWCYLDEYEHYQKTGVWKQNLE
jgi:hypothetical protein